MKEDPKLVKKGGKYICAVCSAELNEVTIKNNDPFCGSMCCRIYHDTPV